MKALLTAALLGCAASGFAQSQAPYTAQILPGTVAVSGSASRMVTPDRAVFSIRITGTANTESESYSRMQEISNRILGLLKQEGFANSQVQLTDYSLTPQYNYTDNRRKFTGYQSSQSLQLKFPLDKERIVRTFSRLAGEVEKGAEVNYGTESSDSLTKAVEQELMVSALKDAAAKARILAETAGQKIRGVASIRYGVRNPSMPIPMQTFSLRKAAVADAAPSTDFSIGEQRFTEEVEANYYLEPKN